MSQMNSFFLDSQEKEPISISSTEALSKFTAVVELLTSNKLTKTNAFENRMVDFISDLFKGIHETTSDSEMKWKKYSTGIDSCGKIYAFCVDYLHSETLKVLGGITRTGAGESQEQVEEEEGKTIKSRKKLNGGNNTLEKDEQSITTSKFEKFDNFDPYFKVISSRFDVSTNKGLLLNNLCLNGMADIVIGEDDSLIKTEPVDLITEIPIPYISNLTEALLQEEVICKTFEKFTHCSCDEGKIANILDSMQNENDLFSEPQSEKSGSEDMDEDGLLRKNDSFELNDSQTLTGLNMIADSIHERINSLAEKDDYNFFASGKTNMWAGLEYWKKVQLSSSLVEKQPRKKKEVNELTLNPSVILDKNQVLAPCKKGYPNYFNEAALKKHEENNTSLPEDYGFSLHRLTQLFTRPRTHVKYVKNSEVHKNIVLDQSAEHPAEEEKALFVDEGLLNQPDRSEEPRNFATVSKTVDIKKLKDVLWRSISVDTNKENSTKSAKGNKFLSIIDSLPRCIDDSMLSSLSIHTCFITILHLANEHGLMLKPDGLCEFSISSGR